jgi:hypothetical protein
MLMSFLEVARDLSTGSHVVSPGGIHASVMGSRAGDGECRVTAAGSDTSPAREMGKRVRYPTSRPLKPPMAERRSEDDPAGYGHRPSDQFSPPASSSRSREALIPSRARMAEVGVLLAVVALPIVIGASMPYLRRPWWWGAAAAIAIFLVAALAPPPEEGESRVALGDLGFLIIVAIIVALLVWIGSWLTGRIRRKSGSTT